MTSLARIIAMLSILTGGVACAQTVKGPLYLADRLMSTNRISRGGRIAMLKMQQDDFAPLGGLPVSAIPDGTQRRSMAEDMDFLEDVLGSGRPDDALAMIFAEGLYAHSDTLSYYRGRGAWSLRQLDTAVAEFASLPDDSVFQPQATLYRSLSLAYMDRMQEALALLDGLQFSGVCEDLRIGQIDGLNRIMAAEWRRNKSPLAAAMMSAVIPGAGKIYAGNLSEGVSALVTVGALAGITAESVSKFGIRDWRSIGLAAVSGLFYAANIYGSYFSVGATQTVIDNANKTAILLNLRLPLAALSGR